MTKPAAHTVRITDKMAAKILNPFDDAHHATVRGLKARGLINLDFLLTAEGLFIKGQLERDPSRRVFVMPTEEDPATSYDGLNVDERRAIERAVLMVANDQRASYPEMTDLEAIEHAQGVLTLPGHGCIGGSEIEDDGTPLAFAYRLVLTYPRAIKGFIRSRTA